MSKPWKAHKIVQRPLKKLTPYERNSRVHPDSQIKKLQASIEQWGWTVPVIIDEKNNLITGHGRIFAAERLGLKTVPCIVAEGWTEDQKRAYVIADNKLAEAARWDIDTLHSELNELLKNSFNIDLIAVDLNIDDDIFIPSVDPVSRSHETTGEDMERAGTGLAQNISNLSGDKSEGAVEVICPYCAETFKFSGV